MGGGRRQLERRRRTTQGPANKSGRGKSQSDNSTGPTATTKHQTTTTAPTSPTKHQTTTPTTTTKL